MTWLRGLHSGLIAFCAVMVVAGIVLPSGSATPDIDLPPAAPVRLAVPSIDLRAAVIPIEVDTEGVLDPPEDVDTVGWWKRSARPGDGSGQTVLTGHTVHNGGGVMSRVGELGQGSRVRVHTSEGTMIYRVTRTEVLSQSQLAERSEALFGQGRRDGRLVLVTCTDWVDGTYTSNIVIFAQPLRAI